MGDQREFCRTKTVFRKEAAGWICIFGLPEGGSAARNVLFAWRRFGGRWFLGWTRADATIAGEPRSEADERGRTSFRTRTASKNAGRASRSLDREWELCLKGPVFPSGKRDDEADLSAQQYQPKADARISGANEHESRPRGDQSAKAKRKKATDGPHLFEVTKPPLGTKRLRSSDRITRKTEFVRCRTKGKRFASRRFVILHFQKTDGPTRVGVVVSKKTGGAVVRNRWKRVVRECFRLERGRLPRGGDEVVIVKGGTQGNPDRGARAELITLFSKVAET